MFARHWTVEVRKGWRPWWETEAEDWQTSGIRIHELGAEIEQGRIPANRLA